MQCFFPVKANTKIRKEENKFFFSVSVSQGEEGGTFLNTGPIELTFKILLLWVSLLMLVQPKFMQSWV